jgi:lipopolysaccharide export system protein LptA
MTQTEETRMPDQIQVQCTQAQVYLTELIRQFEGIEKRSEGGFSSVPNFLSGSTASYAAGAASSVLLPSTWTYKCLYINAAGVTLNPAPAGLTVNENLTLRGGIVDTTGGNYSMMLGNLSVTGGTLKLNASTVSVSGYWDFQSGSFNGNTSTVTFTSTSPQTILTGSGSFNHVRFTGSGGSWTLQDTFTPGGNLTVSAGTVNTGGNTVDISGAVLINGGTVNLTSSQMTARNNWAYTSGTFNYGTSTVTFSANGGAPSILMNGTSFYNVLISTNGSSTTNAATPV